jgi:hypothetical protein
MIRQKFMHNLINIPGWSTDRKIIVIESDDWGSIRMPSLSSFDKLEKLGLDLRTIDAERYNLNDTLATGSDLEKLFEVLGNHKDSVGNSPVFTAVSVVANPDFEKIRKFYFNQYFYEPFTETLKKYPGCEHSFDLWKVGIENKLFIPQMHGREHLNVSAWMRALKDADKQTREAFNEGFWGFVPDQKLLPGVDFQAAFLLGEPGELEFQEKVIAEGLDLFNKLFGFKAEYFVAPNGPFNNKLNKVLVEYGIKFRSASKIQDEPLGNGRTRKVLHWLGQKDKSGLRYITRNCFFEPSQPGKDWIDSCLDNINVAFRWNKPAIISSHRVNYIGSLNLFNRDRSLKDLNRLINSILKAWPNVVFMTTPELGKLMRSRSE